ncbi:MAG: biopolymer transporter ExbD [Mariniblastus sp.]|nr:biopolymer transporter ExbD [Mariniblastus sp.]
MSVKIKRTAAVGSLSITPLIDVVFLLLIFFLVSSRFSEEERELDLNLPSVTEALPATAQTDELVVNIDEQGRYYIDGSFRQLEQVEQILRRAKANNPLTQTVVIRADKKTDCEPLLIAIGLCKKVGISEYTATIDGG